jgi:hypothetical protein
MARSIIAVIVSYIVMFILNLVAFLGLYAVVGPGQAFKARSYLASNRWVLMTGVILLVTGVIAGLSCALIARGGRAPSALALVVIIVGLLLAIPSVMKARANAGMARPAVVSQMEALNYAYWPIWAPFAFPFISAIGVLVGGKLKKRP